MRDPNRNIIDAPVAAAHGPCLRLADTIFASVPARLRQGVRPAFPVPVATGLAGLHKSLIFHEFLQLPRFSVDKSVERMVVGGIFPMGDGRKSPLPIKQATEKHVPEQGLGNPVRVPVQPRSAGCPGCPVCQGVCIRGPLSSD